MAFKEKEEPFFPSEEPYLRRVYRAQHPDAVWTPWRNKFLEKQEVWKARIELLRHPQKGEKKSVRRVASKPAAVIPFKPIIKIGELK